MELKRAAPNGLGDRRSLALLLVVYAGAWFAMGWSSGRLSEKGPAVAPDPAEPIPIALKAPPRVLLQIGDKHLRRLEALRAKALREGVLTESVYVPGRIAVGGEDHAVKLRLKGDWVDHLQGDTWSLRVNVTDGGAVLGMRRFALQRPATRNGLNEAILLAAARGEGLVALRYGFCELELNGHRLGLYAVEEHMGDTLLEANQRRAGPILKVDETLWWEDVREGAAVGSDQPLRVHPERFDHVEPFVPREALADPAQRDAFLRARDGLLGVLRGELAPKSVLDVDRFARYYALSRLLGVDHGLHLHNLRFYANPVSGLLEPVPFDAMAGDLLVGLTRVGEGEDERLWKLLLSEPETAAQVLGHLRRVALPAYLDALLADPALSDQRAWVAADDPANAPTVARFRSNQARLARLLDAPGRLVRAFLDRRAGERLTVTAQNLQDLPVRVRGLVAPGDDAPIPPDADGFLAGRSVGVHRRELTFTVPAEAAGPFSLDCQPLGGAPRREPVLDWPAPTGAPPLLDPAAPPSAHLAWEIDPAARAITLRRGTWTVSEPLVVPRGYTLRCVGGVALELRGAGCLIAFGAVELLGSAAEPVVLRGEGRGGLAVLGADATLRHVRFLRLGVPAVGRWTVTGGVTLHESKVRIADCVFLDCAGEDALNAVRCEVELSGGRFTGSASDALDLDFCSGSVRDVTFEDCGNDAVDVSGSTLELSDLTIKAVGDKGLSVGEGSDILATRLKVQGAPLAVAVKDASSLTLREAVLKEGRLGVAAYVKKPEFGPPSATLTKVQFSKIEHETCVELPAVVLREGKAVPGMTRPKVKALLGPQASSSALEEGKR